MLAHNCPRPYPCNIDDNTHDKHSFFWRILTGEDCQPTISGSFKSLEGFKFEMYIPCTHVRETNSAAFPPLTHTHAHTESPSGHQAWIIWVRVGSHFWGLHSYFSLIRHMTACVVLVTNSVMTSMEICIWNFKESSSKITVHYWNTKYIIGAWESGLAEALFILPVNILYVWGCRLVVGVTVAQVWDSRKLTFLHPETL